MNKSATVVKMVSNLYGLKVNAMFNTEIFMQASLKNLATEPNQFTFSSQQNETFPLRSH